MRTEPEILFDGACAYAVRLVDGTCEVRVHSSNYVEHVAIGIRSAADAKRLCTRLNRYPRQTRAAHGLL